MIYDICIVGAGASGLFAAQYLANRGMSVVLVEGNDAFGKKLRLTGNGRCNLTNEKMESSCFYCKDDSFISSIISTVPNERLFDEFKNILLDTVNLDGYYYPADVSSQSVINALSIPILKSDIKIINKTKVREVQKNDGIFTILGDKNIKASERPVICLSRKLILSCGGASYPKTGSDGSGIKILEKLGLKVTRPLPALVPLICNNRNISMLKGLRHIGRITLLNDKNNTITETGEIQYTEDGLSGIAIFQISRIIVRKIDRGEKAELFIDHIPNMDYDELADNLKRRFSCKNFSLSVQEALNSLIPGRLINYVLAELSISSDTEANKIDSNLLIRISDKLKNDRFEIAESKKLDKAQTISGGIDVSELEFETMEVKKISGLYTTGEMIDCDGICGGYNLYFAFSTSLMACEGIIKKYATDKSN